MNENIKNQLIWVGLWGSIPTILATACQLYWSFNTHLEPVLWRRVPGLTFLIAGLSWISFSADQESVNYTERRTQ